MSKKLLYTLLFILIASSVFLIGYLFDGREDQNALSKFGTAAISRFVKPQETLAPYSLLDKLPSEKVSYPKLSLDGRSITYYDASSGYLHKIEMSETGNKNITLQKLKPYLQNLSWSWDRKLLITHDGADNIVYDLALNSSRIIDQNIKNPVFSPFEDKASYVWQDFAGDVSSTCPAPACGSWVSISNSSFEFYKNLIPVRDDSWKPSWNNSHTLSLEYKNNKKMSLFTLATDTNNLTRIVADKDNLEIKWSPDGSGLLYSYLSGGKLLLYSSNLSTGYQGLPLPKSISASKCAWSIDNETAYCAVSNDSTDEFLSFKTSAPDLFETLKTDISIKISAADLFLSADEHYLFFKNSLDGSLYRLKIE